MNRLINQHQTTEYAKYLHALPWHAPLFIALLFNTTLSCANEPESLFDMTLDELIEVTVSVASSKPESVLDTPAIVSRYNRADMEKMGISNLKEMFNFIPGVIVQDSLIGWSSVQIRGIDEAFNQKVLFLLDGIPYHQPSHSMIPMEGVPWESISHVEVIRGPGAVFYGTQASAGVLNVITHKSHSENTLSLKTGSNNLYEGSGYFNKQFSTESSITIAAEYRVEDGYSTNYSQNFPIVGTVSDSVHRELEKKSGLIRYTKNHFSILLQAFSDKTIGINDAYTNKTTLQPAIMETEGKLFHIENSWVNERTTTTLFADYNNYTFDFRINNLFGLNSDALVTKDNNGKEDYRLRYGGSIDHQVNSSLAIFSGLENETRSTNAYKIFQIDNTNLPLATLLQKNKVDELSAYSQINYTISDWRFILGGRYTDNEKSGDKITPRAAIVYRLDQHQSLKALYSTGFNSPNSLQTNLNAPGNVIGNESLSAEVVTTFDLAYSYSRSNLLFVANIYTLEADDFITRRYSEQIDSVTFLNESNYRRNGAEFDLQLASNSNKYFINLAYQKEGNKEIVDDPSAFNTPRFTFSAGVSSDLSDIHSIGADINYIDDRHNLDGYSVVNANYTARISNFEFSLIARNIFDEDIRNPNNTIQNADLVAYGEEGKNFQAGIKLHF